MPKKTSYSTRDSGVMSNARSKAERKATLDCLMGRGTPEAMRKAQEANVTKHAEEPRGKSNQ
jgi:hypothetical protein